jgi:type II secretory pathway pseudopilin PulG
MRPPCCGEPGSRPETGSVTPFVLLLVVALCAVLALVAEGGALMTARLATEAEAEQAARAGAAVLSAATLRAGGIATGGQAAVAAAERYMAEGGHPGRAWATADSVTAEVNPYTVATPLLSLVGISGETVTASATAVAVAG